MLMVAGIFAVLATIADMFRDTVGFSCNPIYLVHVLGHMAFFCTAFMLGDCLIERFLAGRKSIVDVPRQVHVRWFDNLCDMAFSGIPQTYAFGGIVKLGAIIYACWSPLLVLLFPGVIWWDTRQQLLQYNGLPNALSEGVITDHHPVIDTYLYGWFTDLGRALGSVDAGVYAFCLVQAFLTACALAFAWRYWRFCACIGTFPSTPLPWRRMPPSCRFSYCSRLPPLRLCAQGGDS